MAKCKACGLELAQLEGGHRQREYCNDACKHVGLRRRKEDQRKEEMRQRWAPYAPETQVYLDWLLKHYGEDHIQGVVTVLIREVAGQGRVAGKEHLAEVERELAQAKQGLDDVQQRFKQYVGVTNERVSGLVGEIRQLQKAEAACQKRTVELEQELALSQKNGVACQEKLSQTSGRIQKLERQVEVQRERLSQSYQQPVVDSQAQRGAFLEQELARYRQIVDLSDRQKLQQQLLDTGAQINYRQLLAADSFPGVGEGEEFWRSFAGYRSIEELAAAAVRAKYYAENLIWVDAQAEVQRLKARVRVLECQLQANGTP